jgi:hypothetical protein
LFPNSFRRLRMQIQGEALQAQLLLKKLFQIYWLI